MAQYIHCFKPSNVAAPQLWLDLHWPSTSCVSGPSVLQDLFDAGPPLLQVCHATTTLKRPLLSNTSTIATSPLPQDFHCCWTCTVLASFPLSQDLYYCRDSNIAGPLTLRTSTVAGPLLLMHLHCHRTSTVPISSPLSQDLHFLRASAIQSALLLQGLHCLTQDLHRVSTAAALSQSQGIYYPSLIFMVSGFPLL